MDSFEKEIYKKASSLKDAYPKALADFMFRQVIEDAHSKYNISNEDIKAMCKDAVNRAAAFLDIMNNPDMYRGFVMYAINGTQWDDAETTIYLKEQKEQLEVWGKSFE